MRSNTLPSPPEEMSRGNSAPKSKTLKHPSRSSKNSRHNAATSHHHDHIAHSSSMDGRHKRVWKACERCRMKKTKCDGEFPCKRCKDDGLICTAGVRKKIEYKQLPRGYAEVLENTQFALVATVLKLYSMVRQNGGWDLGEPDHNDRGQPVIHSIASLLGCIRPNSDIDLPVHSVFPEDQSGLDELARQLDEHHRRADFGKGSRDSESSAWNSASVHNHMHSDSPVSSPDLEHSDYEHDHRKLAFGRDNGSGNSSLSSPQSFIAGNDFDFAPAPGAPLIDSTATLFPTRSPIVQYNSGWPQRLREPQIMEAELMMPTLQPQSVQPSLTKTELLQQGLLESNFGTIKPHELSFSNQSVMLGLGDPMMYHYGGEDDQMLTMG